MALPSGMRNPVQYQREVTQCARRLHWHKIVDIISLEQEGAGERAACSCGNEGSVRIYGNATVEGGLEIWVGAAASHWE